MKLSSIPTRCRAAVRSGFSLIELLVVIAIIALLGGVMVAALDTGSSTQGVGAGVRTLNSMIQTARTVAAMHNQTTYLIIYNKEDVPDRYMRYMGVIYEDPNMPGQWICANQGATLPEGVVIVAKDMNDSNFTQPANGLNDLKGKADNAAETLNLSKSFPINETQGTSAGSDWLAYKFGSDGMAQPGTANKKILVARADRSGEDTYQINNPNLAMVSMISLFGSTIVGEYADL